MEEVKSLNLLLKEDKTKAIKKIEQLHQVGYSNVQIAVAFGVEPSEIRSILCLENTHKMKLWLVTFPEPKYSTVDIGIAAIVAASTLSEVKSTILREKKQSVIGDRYPDCLKDSKYKIISHTSVYKRPRVVLVDYRSG